uniref:Protein quiver n=1 Tax=Ascaris lumbricoides TaxID=6252 RepID=A0A0M3HYZ3_ASCLU
MFSTILSTAPFSVVFLFFLLSHLYGTSEALICYENDDNGKIYEVTNNTWNYCVLIPSTSVRPNSGRVFGVGPSADWTDVYDHTFALSDKVYKILTVCVLEKYDFGVLAPKFSGASIPPEFMFRCVCNYDRCNSATTFSSYLSALKEDNSL